MRWPSAGLRRQLLLVVLLAGLPAIGLLFYTGLEVQRNAQYAARENVVRWSRIVIHEYNALIERTREFLVTLSQLPILQSDAPSSCSAAMAEVLAEQQLYLNLGAIDISGNAYCSALPLNVPVNAADRSYFQNALKNKEFSVGEFQIGRATGQPSINFGYPIVDEADNVRAVVFAALSLDWLNEFAAKVQFPEATTLTLIDQQGIVLARYPDPERWVGTSAAEMPLVSTLTAQGGHGVAETTGLDGTVRLYAFEKLQGPERTGALYLSIGIPIESVVAEAGRLMVRNLTLSISLVGMALVLAWVGGEFLVARRLRAIIYTVQRVGAGDLSARSGLVERADELSQLARAFDSMAEALEKQTQESQQAHVETQRQLQHIGALRDIDLAIMSSLDLRVILKVFLDQVTTQLQVDAAAVLLFKPATQTLEFAAGRGFGGQRITRTRLHLGEGLAGQAALERRAAHMPRLEEAAEFHHSQLLNEEGIKGYSCLPLIAKGEIQGVLEIFHRSPLETNQEWLNFLEALAGQAAIAIDNANLFQSLQRSNAELAISYDATLEGWAKGLELREKETEGHTQRVTEVCVRLAQRLGIGSADLVHLRRGALLHDIGKIGIPDSILLKPSPLTDEEWQVMRQHPVYAYEWLKAVPYLRPALDIPYCHHERWDGSGYPRGLKGEEIPLAARVFAVVDVWDALCSKRPYRDAWPEEKALEYLTEQAGKQFDPQVVAIFVELLKQGSAV